MSLTVGQLMLRPEYAFEKTPRATNIDNFFVSVFNISYHGSFCALIGLYFNPLFYLITFCVIQVHFAFNKIQNVIIRVLFYHIFRCCMYYHVLHARFNCLISYAIRITLTLSD